MQIKQTLLIAGIAVAAAGAIGATATVALAQADGGTNDAMAAPRPATSLAAAVGAAENAAAGYATRAEYERTKTGWAYDVEVVSGSKVFDVRVDAASGKILSTLEDQADQGDEADEDGADHRD